MNLDRFLKDVILFASFYLLCVISVWLLGDFTAEGILFGIVVCVVVLGACWFSFLILVGLINFLIKRYE